MNEHLQHSRIRYGWKRYIMPRHWFIVFYYSQPETKGALVLSLFAAFLLIWCIVSLPESIDKDRIFQDHQYSGVYKNYDAR